MLPEQSRVLPKLTDILTAGALAALVVGPAACGSVSAPESSTPMASGSPLVGVWQRESVTDAGGAPIEAPAEIRVVTAEHMVAVGHGPQMPPKPAMAFLPTPQEALAIMTTFRAGAGAYTYDGSTLTWRLLSAANPSMIGGTVTFAVEVTVDTMTSRLVSAVDADGASPPELNSTTATFRRMASASAADPLFGVWQQSSGLGSGVTIITDSHIASVGYASPEVPAKPATTFELTEEEAHAIHLPLRAGVGTYTRDGSTLTWQMLVHNNPAMMGGIVRLEASASGDTLTGRALSVVDADGASPAMTFPGETATWRRLE